MWNILRFKLRMFGIPIYDDGESTHISCGNKIECSQWSMQDSMGTNRWNVAAGVCKIAWVPTGENIADAMTKRLSVTQREYLFSRWTY